MEMDTGAHTHTHTHTHILCSGSMALYCAVKPLPAMLLSERKVTQTELLLVLKVGGATLPQSLLQEREGGGGEQSRREGEERRRV